MHLTRPNALALYVVSTICPPPPSPPSVSLNKERFFSKIKQSLSWPWCHHLSVMVTRRLEMVLFSVSQRTLDGDWLTWRIYLQWEMPA